MKGAQDDISDAESRRLKRRKKRIIKLSGEIDIDFYKKHSKEG